MVDAAFARADFLNRGARLLCGGFHKLDKWLWAIICTSDVGRIE